MNSGSSHGKETCLKRRTFLTAAASAFPLTLTQPFALAIDSSETSAKEIHVVGADKDRFNESHAPGYSEIRFKTSSEETPSIFAIEHSNLLPGGPPIHLHFEQDEWFYVIEGEVLFQVGNRRVQLKAGESVLGPRRIPHAFTAVGATPARMLIVFTPAGKMERFFRDTAALGPQQSAAVYGHYGMKRLGPPLKAT
mgnify:CR=1 FL=1